jgi:hypothetical protein
MMQRATGAHGKRIVGEGARTDAEQTLIGVGQGRRIPHHHSQCGSYDKASAAKARERALAFSKKYIG